MREHLPVAEQVHVAQVIGETMRTHEPFFYRLRDVTLGPLLSDGSHQIIDVHGEVEIDDGGTPIALLGVCQNVAKSCAKKPTRSRRNSIAPMTREALTSSFSTP